MNVDQQMRQGVSLADTIANGALASEPRINIAQQVAFDQVLNADPEARLLGLDSKHRPVVLARTGIPQRITKWALLRNGDPTDATQLMEAYSNEAPR